MQQYLKNPPDLNSRLSNLQASDTNRDLADNAHICTEMPPKTLLWCAGLLQLVKE